MRAWLVLAVALGASLAAMPTAASADECANTSGELMTCVRLPIGSTDGPIRPYAGTYYVYVGASDCLDAPLSSACHARPFAPQSGVYLPGYDGYISGGVIGLVFQETNGIPGLQRAMSQGPFRFADRVVVG